MLGGVLRKEVEGPNKKGWEGEQDKCQGKTRRGPGIRAGQRKDIGTD